jgi:hypothetical protein
VKKHLLLLILATAVAFGCKDKNEPQGAPPAGEAASESQSGEGYTAEEAREKGMEYAMATQAVLGKTLQEKIKSEGTVAAIEFCNLRALPITDSLSREKGAAISRITDRPRNPLNRASDEEMKFISRFRSEMAAGEAPEALVVRQDNRTNFYYPILTNNLCLQCHGRPEKEITPEVLSVLRERYPEDSATGYAANEFRGLWKVSFPMKQR